MSSNHKNLKNKLVCVLLGLLFSIIPVLGFVTFFTSEGVYLEAKIKLEKDGCVKIYSSGSENTDWKDEACLISRKFKGGKSVEFSTRIKTPQIRLLRFEIQSSAPGTHKISALKLKGDERASLKHIKIQKFKNLKILQSTNRKTIFRSSSGTSEIIFYSTKEVRGKKTFFSWEVLLCLLLSTFVFSFFLIRKESSSGIKNKQDLFLVFFFVNLLFIPCWKFDRSAELRDENRKKAPFPAFVTSNRKINNNFGREFDKYISDRFYGRRFLISLWQRLRSWEEDISGVSQGEEVIKGKDGWYFHTGDDAVENFKNTAVFTPYELKENLKTLTALDKFCKAHGIRFYYFIAPDKHKIYGEALSSFSKLRPDSESRAAQWVRYIRKNSTVKVVYPIESMIAAKGEKILYYKTDTHWNKLGAHLAYLELGKVIKKDFPALNLFRGNKLTSYSHPKGDLQLLCPAFVPEDKTQYKEPLLPRKFQLRHNAPKEYNFTNPRGSYSLLFLRDSFGTDMLPFFYCSFRHVNSFWQYNIPDKILRNLKQKKPDILILEHVERYLPRAMDELKKYPVPLKSGVK